MIGLARFDWDEFAGYRRVNELFAHSLARLLQPDDLVWVHDYHLLCLADALRAKGIDNKLGLFLHTPFPEQGVLMTVPAHAELVRAMCGYDLLGCHCFLARRIDRKVTRWASRRQKRK